MADAFTPVLYVYPQCPFCFKVRLFLLEAGLRDQVEIVEVEKGSDDETRVRAEIEPHVSKVSFPTLQTGPNAYVGDSDTIIAWFENRFGADRGTMETLDVYVRGPFESQRKLFRENRELKEKLGAA